MSSINALHRGLIVLRAINDGHAQIREIAAVTRLPKSTVARMVETLMADGYLLQNERKGYHPTARVLTLSRGYQAGNMLLEVARPVLEGLRQHQIWPTDLAVLDQDAMVIMDTGRDPGTLSLNRTVGSRLPVLATALGRAFLAFASPKVVEETLMRLAQSSNPFDAPAKNPESVRRLLAQVRRQGYATGDREYQRTTRTAAVPIMVNGAPVASLNIMVVPSAMSLEQLVRTLLPSVRSAAKAISTALSQGPRR
ncbi:MAG: IclR family transcriptional regulator C-terminal domain-containing protein [Pseudorhodoplanes sp.]|jgi:IclR family mhp operon transcriptional activator|nr:IclR family transcriptional regulator C-terminal domain-containing protein [Pseudorhodoplanes sp.]